VKIGYTWCEVIAVAKGSPGEQKQDDGVGGKDPSVPYGELPPSDLERILPLIWPKEVPSHFDAS